MNKFFKYMLLVGVSCAMTFASVAKADYDGFSYQSGKTDAVKGVASAMELAEMIVSGGWPVMDITSIPAHALVAAEQELIREATEDEKELKAQIRKRLSVPYKNMPKKSDGEDGGDGEISDADIDTETNEEGEEKEETEKIKVDAKLSKIKIETDGAISPVSEGLVGVDDMMTSEGESSTYDLANKQQKNYTSSAGTIDTKEAYEDQRLYQEQRQAVRLLAKAIALRQSVSAQLETVMSEVQKTYEESEAKKDLDPENKKKTIEKTNDYNQALRQYAYYSLVYDQLLSLEQQLMGLRLQVRGGLSEQTATPLTQEINTEK